MYDTIFVYEARWWSSVDQGWSEIRMLGDSKEQVKEYVNKLCAKEFRLRPKDLYIEGPKRDSLTIKISSVIDELPILIEDL